MREWGKNESCPRDKTMSLGHQFSVERKTSSSFVRGNALPVNIVHICVASSCVTFKITSAFDTMIVKIHGLCVLEDFTNIYGIL